MKHDKAQSHNEQVKHYANFFSVIGLTILIAGAITPIFDSDQAFYPVSIPAGLVFWAYSAYIVSHMVKSEA